MGSLNIPKTYSDGDVLLAADLDNFKTAPETFLNVTKLNDDNVANNGITASTKLVNSSVTAAKLASSSVVEAKILDAAVTTVKIPDSAVTTAKIAASAVTRAERNTLSLAGSEFDSTSAGTTEATLTSVSITTAGRPVLVGIKPDATATTDSFISTITSTVTTIEHDLNLRIYRDSTLVQEVHMRFYDDQPDGTNQTYSYYTPTGAIWVLDFPAAGTYTYALKYQNDVSGMTKSSIGSLFAVEL